MAELIPFQSQNNYEPAGRLPTGVITNCELRMIDKSISHYKILEELGRGRDVFYIRNCIYGRANYISLQNH